LFGFNVRAGVPQGYEPDANFVAAARAKGVRIDIVRDAREAVAGADLVVTDTWVSMGQDHAHNKVAAMAPFQVDERLMAGAKDDAVFLHCLPAHRGEEVVDAVIDGAQSRVWDEAENRVHAQKSILLWALGKL
jgi:ornithine carbamoyltransferase